MPKLLGALPPQDTAEEHKVRKLANSRHAPADWIMRARMIARSWDGLRTAAIAEELGCHPQTVRERFHRFNAEGIDGLADRPGAGRKPRITEQERSKIIALLSKGLLEGRLHLPTHNEPPKDLLGSGTKVGAQQGLGFELSLRVAHQYPAYGHGGQPRAVPHRSGRSHLQGAFPTTVPVLNYGGSPNGGGIFSDD
jgi:hypothetical protein